jgi:hypothetical protein
MAIRKVRQPPGWHRAYYFRHGEDRGLPGPIKKTPRVAANTHDLVIQST